MKFPRPTIKVFWNLKNFQQPCLLSGTSLSAENKNVITHKYSRTFTTFDLVHPQTAEVYISREFYYEPTNSSLKPNDCECTSQTVAQLLNTLLDLYETLRLITKYRKAGLWVVSWGTRIQSTPSRRVLLRSVWILNSNTRSGLPSGLFPSHFPTKIPYAFSPFQCTRHASRPYQPPWFVH